MRILLHFLIIPSSISSRWCFIKNSRFKSLFDIFFVQQNMVETTLPDGLETSGQRAYCQFCHISRRFWVFAFLVIFFVFQKNRVFGYSWSTLLWHRCYYPHWSRDALSPVCGILFYYYLFYLQSMALRTFLSLQWILYLKNLGALKKLGTMYVFLLKFLLLQN